MIRLRISAVSAVICALSFIGACAFDSSGAAEAPGVEPPGSQEPGAPVDEPSATGVDAAPVPAVATAFRISRLALRDPHMFASSGGFGGGCNDITDNGANSVNAQINDALSDDDDGDGALDRGIVLVFRPFDAPLTINDVQLVNARCTAPPAATSCAPIEDPVSTLARDIGAPACDVPPSVATSDYAPPIALSSAPCFATDPVAFTLPLIDDIPQTDLVVSATYAADGTGLVGTVRGFLSEADAQVLEVGGGANGLTISRFLPGGEGACAGSDDRDVGPGGELGWYTYFNFEAVPVLYEDLVVTPDAVGRRAR